MNPGEPALLAPPGLATNEFVLRPIQEADAACDHEAVMETRDFLRDWEGTGWPEDGFTVAANREDLIRLRRRHQNAESFTYTVVDPAAERCLGCVYVFPTGAPLFAKADIKPRGQAQWSDFRAAVYFWVRKTSMDKGLDAQLLKALDTWFQRDWRLANCLWITNERVHQQIALLEGSGRMTRFELAYASKPSRELAFS